MEHLGVLKNLFLGRGLENQSTRSWRKTSRSKGENQQQTQPTYGINIYAGIPRVLSPLSHPFSK